jgi:transcriptional regulator of acetoin/glycerol metabolism
MPETAARRSRIATARADFIQFGPAESPALPDVVASVVSASWQRSFAAGVNAATTQAAFHEDLDLTGRLVRCARPVIVRLSDDMSEMPLSIVLTDSRARILSRSETDKTIGTLLDKVSLAPGFNYAEASVGTNGIGTVLESGQPLYIVGPEHFHEHLQPFACAGSPIQDPLTGRIEGVLDISCLSEHSSPLMNSLVRSAAHEIEHNLLVDRSQRQQALFEAYVKLDSRSRGAVMAIGGSIVMGNAVAQNLFEPAEQWTIHEHGRYLMTGQGQPVDRIQLSTGKVVFIREPSSSLARTWRELSWSLTSFLMQRGLTVGFRSRSIPPLNSRSPTRSAGSQPNSPPHQFSAMAAPCWESAPRRRLWTLSNRRDPCW